MIATKTPEKIHHDISEKLAKGVSYIDALIEYSRENDIEIETIAEIVKKSAVIREKIRAEAISMRLIKRDASDTCQLF